MEDSLRHANHCRELLDAGSLSAALEYCKAQRIDPPQCTLTAESANADNLRAIAKNMLLDPGWPTTCAARSSAAPNGQPSAAACNPRPRCAARAAEKQYIG